MLYVFEYQYNFIFHFFMGSLEQNIWIKLGKIFLRKWGCLVMAMATDACWVGYFVSNHVFLCRTGYFCVELGFFVSNECYKICAEYRDMLPRPRLVCQKPGLRPICLSSGVPDKTSRGLGSMSRYSAQILICFIAYIFQFSIPLWVGWGILCLGTACADSVFCPL